MCYIVHRRLQDHSERTVDLRPWSQGPVFEPVKDPDYFREFFMEGGTVAWPNGADIAPATLHEAATRKRKGGMHPPWVGTKTRGRQSMRRTPVNIAQAFHRSGGKWDSPT